MIHPQPTPSPIGHKREPRGDVMTNPEGRDEEKIYRVDDGSVWYFTATSEADARKRWVDYLTKEQDYEDEAAVLRDYDEPKIRRVALKDAAGITVKLDETEEYRCEHCRSMAKRTKTMSLLAVWHEDKAAKTRAPHGALCNSEWP